MIISWVTHAFISWAIYVVLIGAFYWSTGFLPLWVVIVAALIPVVFYYLREVGQARRKGLGGNPFTWGTDAKGDLAAPILAMLFAVAATLYLANVRY